MSISIENAKENVKDTVDRCIKCGLCKNNCPVLKVLREEQYSPRGKCIVLASKIFDRLVYDCTLCKACDLQCPMKLELSDAFIKARKVLVLRNKELSENKEMIANLRNTGNIYGVEAKDDYDEEN